MLNYEQFKTPQLGFGTVPFWFWNDKIENAEITRQLNLMKEQHVDEFIIHARGGLETPYFSEEWFDCIRHAITEAKRFGMGVWLYDENSFPSGFADGMVLKENADYCAKNLRVTVCEPGCSPSLPEGSRIIAVFIKDSAGNWIRVEHGDGVNQCWFFTMEYTVWKTAYSKMLYVDVLNPAVGKTFIRVTHEEYYHRFSDYFGNVIRGFFSDEAGFYNNLQIPWSDRHDDNTVVWTDSLPEYFKLKNGYDVLDNLPYLFYDCQQTSPHVRRDFYDTVCSLYRESFLSPQRKFCDRSGIAFIGHLHYEDYLHMQIATQGDFTKALSEFTYPGCDRIEYHTEQISEKLVSSIACQYGKKRVLSESFAQGGWDFSFDDLRRWSDYQLVRGINMIVPHAFFYSTRGPRRDDCPPSYFFQNPLYPNYHRFSDYISRLCSVLSQGDPVCPLALYYPVSSGQSSYNPANREEVTWLDRDIQSVAFGLLDAQYDFCFLNDEAFDGLMAEDNIFRVGNGTFHALVILTRRMPYTVMQSVSLLARSGIPIVFLKFKPVCIESKHSSSFNESFDKLISLPNVAVIEEYYLYKKYTYCFDPACMYAAEGFERAVKPIIELSMPDSGVKCTSRRYENKTLYFIVNEKSTGCENCLIFNEIGTPIIWDAMTGERKACPYEQINEKAYVPVKIAGYSSLLLVFGDESEY